jgi:hypothetical protein
VFGLRRQLASGCIAGALAGAVLFGCSSDDSATPAAPNTKTTEAARPGAAAGSYEARLKADRANRILGGVWTLEIFGSAAYLRPPADPDSALGGRGYPIDVGNPIKVDGDELQLGEARVCARQVPGRYTLRPSSGGEQLRITLGEDRCDFRAAVLTAQTWQRFSTSALDLGGR